MPSREELARSLLRAIEQQRLPFGNNPVPHGNEAFLLDNSEEWAVLSEDREGRLNFYSRAAGKLFGYTQVEALGMQSVDLAPRELRAGREQLFHEVLEGRVAKPVETERITKTNERIKISGYVFPYELAPEGLSIGAMVKRI